MKEIGIFKIDKNMCSNCGEDENCPQKYSVNGNCLYIEKDLVKEQVPESFKEFKEMCKIEDISECDDEVKIQWHNNTCLYFYEKDGEIICKDEDSCIEMIIGYDRTPAQMWQIIKNLVGE